MNEKELIGNVEVHVKYMGEWLTMGRKEKFRVYGKTGRLMLLTTSKKVAQQVRKNLQLLKKKEPEKTTE